MSNVTPLLKCQCGASARKVGVFLAGEPVVTVNACQECVDSGVKLLDKVRPVFDAMIAQGVSRDVANATMTYLLEKMT